MAPPSLSIAPPLLNSATPWATRLEDLRAILLSPSTGAVTTRTSLIRGFDHQHSQYQYLFFDPATGKPDQGTSSTPAPPLGHSPEAASSLNNLGYSPIVLDEYLRYVDELARGYPECIHKTIIISVTGPPEEMSMCHERIKGACRCGSFPLAMEINLSCPNIPGASPPAYDATALTNYLSHLPETASLPIGIKTPPYTHDGQFETLIKAVRAVSSRLSFITSTNTLGSCLVLDDDSKPQLPGSGLGGMAGPALHPLALGNVARIRKLLGQEQDLAHIQVIGVGGVGDGHGYQRMRAVGAYAVAVGTALGKQGPGIFERIEKDIEGAW